MAFFVLFSRAYVFDKRRRFWEIILDGKKYWSKKNGQVRSDNIHVIYAKSLWMLVLKFKIKKLTWCMEVCKTLSSKPWRHFVKYKWGALVLIENNSLMSKIITGQDIQNFDNEYVYKVIGSVVYVIHKR